MLALPSLTENASLMKETEAPYQRLETQVSMPMEPTSSDLIKNEEEENHNQSSFARSSENQASNGLYSISGLASKGIIYF